MGASTRWPTWRDLDPEPRYLVVGETHPKVVEREGEAYRHALMARAAAGGVGHLVEFDARYLDSAALDRIVAGADVVILPYDSREQVTSGVLVEALAAGKPVIATGFPHAVELLGGGTGLIVPHGDPPAMAAGAAPGADRPGLAARLGAQAAALAPQLLWPAVADRYRTLAGELIDGRATRRWRDDPGAAVRASPAAQRRHGPARARPGRRSPPRMRLLRRRRRPGPGRGLPPAVAPRLRSPAVGERYLAFLDHAQAGDGASTTASAYDRRWTDQPGLGDWWGRSLWGSGTAAARGRSARFRGRRPHPFRRRCGLPVALAPGHGLRRPRAPPRSSPRIRPCGSPRSAAGGRRRPDSGVRADDVVALARTPAALRQRRLGGGADGRRLGSGGRPPGRRRSPPARVAARGRDGRRPPLAHAGGRLGARANPGRASTSSRSRRPAWPTPAPGPSCSPGTSTSSAA